MCCSLYYVAWYQHSAVPHRNVCGRYKYYCLLCRVCHCNSACNTFTKLLVSPHLHHGFTLYTWNIRALGLCFYFMSPIRHCRAATWKSTVDTGIWCLSTRSAFCVLLQLLLESTCKSYLWSNFIFVHFSRLVLIMVKRIIVMMIVNWHWKLWNTFYLQAFMLNSSLWQGSACVLLYLMYLSHFSLYV